MYSASFGFQRNKIKSTFVGIKFNSNEQTRTH